MDAQTLNDLTYDETNGLNENPEVTVRGPSGNIWRIADHELDDREPGDPFVLRIVPVDA